MTGADSTQPRATGRILFEREHTVLEAMRKGQSPGRCALPSCHGPLPRGRRLWCRDDHYREAYRASVVFDWNAVRDEVLKRDRLTCRQCGRRPLSKHREGPKENWAEVDHVESVADRPDLQFSKENMRTLCHRCHAEKTKAEGKGRKEAGKPRPARTVSLNTEVGAKLQAVFSETPPVPKNKKNAVNADLLGNMGIVEVALKHGITQNAAKGMWSALKSAGIVPAEAKPGQLVLKPVQLPSPAPTSPEGSQPAAPPVFPQTAQVHVSPGYPGVGQPLPPGTVMTTAGPAVVQAAPPPIIQAQPSQSAPPQPTVVQPTASQPSPVQLPAYDVVKTQNGFPETRPPLAGVPMPLEATGFVTKVYQNPKTLMWYDFFKQKHRDKLGREWEGDFADFIADCVEFMFKSQGYIIVIRQDKVA